jgi:hypothetical protein
MSRWDEDKSSAKRALNLGGYWPTEEPSFSEEQRDDWETNIERNLQALSPRGLLAVGLLIDTLSGPHELRPGDHELASEISDALAKSARR